MNDIQPADYAAYDGFLLTDDQLALVVEEAMSLGLEEAIGLAPVHEHATYARLEP